MLTKYRTWIEIDESALSQNIHALKKLSKKGARFCAVVKANAYGHGLKEVSRILARLDVDAFAVDHIDDALFLKQTFPHALTLVLGMTLSDRLKEAVEAEIDLTLYEKEQIERLELEATKQAKKARIHLKIETGTHRQGVLKEDLPEIVSTIRECPHVDLVGVSTHFANIEDTSNPEYATMQFQKFQEAIHCIQQAGLEPEHLHCACSAAIILYPDVHGTFVRSGISMYGLWPSTVVEETVRRQNIALNLEPVLTWKTRIAQIKSLPIGTPVGYGLTEVLKQRSRIAILPVGYFDGYNRSLSSQGEVLVGGYRCKVVGRVCMNMMMVDVSQVPNLEREQEVILIGTNGRHIVSAEFLAEKCRTISYEIVSRIHPLLPRIVV